MELKGLTKDQLADLRTILELARRDAVDTDVRCVLKGLINEINDEPDDTLTKDTVLRLDKEVVTRYFTDDMGTEGITELGIYLSEGGYYIGRMCAEGPYSRNSRYFVSGHEAQIALEKGEYNEEIILK